MTFLRLKALILCWILFTVPLYANGINPDEPIEFVPYPNGKLVDPQVSAEIVYRSGTDDFQYNYSLLLKPTSQQNLFTFSIKSEAEIENQNIGEDRALWMGPPTDVAPACIIAVPALVEAQPRPGESMEFSFTSTGVPCVADTYAQGWVEPPSGQQVVLPPSDQDATWENTQVHLRALGPFKRSESLSVLEETDFLLQEVPKALELGWVSAAAGLDTRLISLRASVAAGNETEAHQKAQQLAQDLDSYRGVSITDDGYYLLRPHLDRIAHLQQPDESTDQTLQPSKDAFIYDKGPHVNEGANPRLPLKKVTGKPAHFAVGFDLGAVNTTGLTKATLVLSIDSDQNVTGWGNGRTIRARRLTTDWVEGNGKSLDLPNNQKTPGSGQGVTWFSPIDANISNNQANSTTAWSGGPSFTNAPTAPLVTIHNHDEGEVSFDVTQDLIAGATNGWLVTRDDDVGSQVTFFSKEGALTAGDPDLAPRLILEYGGTALEGDQLRGLASSLPRLGAYMVSALTSPILQLGETAYRSWAALAMPTLAFENWNQWSLVSTGSLAWAES